MSDYSSLITALRQRAKNPMIDATTCEFETQAADAIEALQKLLNSPETEDFARGVQLEQAHQVARWGEAHDRSKSAENRFFLIGYLSGKALRAAIDGNREKALHHTISSGAALANWHAAIKRDTSGCGLGTDTDLAVLDGKAA